MTTEETWNEHDEIIFLYIEIVNLMNNSTGVAEVLVKDYLQSRGFNASLKSLDADIDTDKDSKNQVQKFLEDSTNAIEKHDIDRLKNIWIFWSTRVFNHLTGEPKRLATQFENDIFRLYLVRCYQKQQQDKCVEFFKKMSPLIVNNPAWSEWYSFPYNPSPQEHDPYKKYFNPQWSKIFMMSLHNFLSVSITNSSRTPLVGMLDELGKMEREKQPNGLFEDELIDDFAVIAQCSGPMKASTSKPSLKTILKNLTGGSKKNSSD